jgi:hypothetical protein
MDREAVVIEMGLMSRLHEWWRRRAVGAPSEVHEQGNRAAARIIQRARQDLDITAKELEIYKLALAEESRRRAQK